MGAKPSHSDSAGDDGGWLSDSVYEMYKPENEDEIACEILFFHGLQMTADKKKIKEAYRTTWLTADRKECWLQTFLPRAFDNKIRVLSVTYDSAAFKTSDTGRFDLFLTGEKLVGSIIKNSSVNVDQRAVPVILVAHSFGGLAVKQMIVHADHEMELKAHTSKQIAKFLKCLKGVFFYATPHLGASLAEYQEFLPSFFKAFRGPVLEELLPLSSEGSRLNAKFELVKKKHDISSMCLIERERIKLVGPLSVTVVDEASGRDSGTDEIRPVEADHFSICKPDSASSENFTYLRDFIKRFLPVSQQRVAVEDTQVAGLDS